MTESKQKLLKVIAGTPDRPLRIGEIEIACYVLEAEIRVLSKRGLHSAFGVSWGGDSTKSNGHEIEEPDFAIPEGVHESSVIAGEMPRFLSNQWLSPYINDELRMGLKTNIVFETPTGRTAYGYPATILVDVCDAILTAHLDGATTVRQLGLVARTKTLINGFATVGIIGLIDEATGYQQRRHEDALARILKKYLSKSWHEWTKTFPYDFYNEIFRLKSWDGPNGAKRPQVIGHYTNDLVYARLAPGVLDELQERNPMLPSGRRETHHHQWFTPSYGHPKLLEHLAGVIALMKSSVSWDSFMRRINRVYPKHGTTIPFDFPDDDEE